MTTHEFFHENILLKYTFTKLIKEPEKLLKMSVSKPNGQVIN